MRSNTCATGSTLKPASVSGFGSIIDSKEPTMPFKDFALQEARFAQLQRTKPELAEHLFSLAQRDIDERIAYYKQLVEVQRYVNE